ncbi:hypothetical protein BCR32DRAFT_291291 [Anaeromyces robustus]|uniref:Bromo domain-containing protein n=1 Tax=Anaeromyces robustus TaxID=1754192 RepID=A0A1Y1XFL1_9FUNG|nr:hypothetical protein BCR32DRAFT_291291 [Anaeromyces robustus]|eukprot:ORX84482.1 hypothetical protein BCR32DRAFT_291291 [Anaeromyces robustus]
MLNSYELVKSLEKRKIWQEYMTQNECKILKNALNSNDSFNNFMNQKETTVTANYLARLHTQQMISEQLLSNLYKDIPKCPIDKEPNPTIQVMKSLFKPVIDDDDDNYDFDEEETKVEIKVEEKTENKIDKKEEEENERDVVLDDMYYTLEYDEDAENEFNNKKLEEDKKEKEEEEKQEQPKIQLPVRNYLDLPNAKFLSAYIDSHLSSQASYALKTLIADLKPISKSKWYNEDRIGQDVLYDHCERILNDLKNYAEHSAPFLNKVNKRDAPNYYEIIKKPMDLSLMTRKLKGLQYNSKEEFESDLELIWSNCLAYNTDPKSPFRTHAIKMRAKANSLMKSVPNIVIKVKGDSDSEDDASHITKNDTLTNQNSSSSLDNEKSIKSMDIDKSNIKQENLNNDEEEKSLFEKGEDVKTMKWKEDTLELRVKKFTEMEEEFKKPFNERKTIIRDPIKMKEYYDDEKEAAKKIKNYFKNNKENSSFNEDLNLSLPNLSNINDTKDSNIPSTSTSTKTSKKSFYPEYSYFSSSIPEISQIPYDIGTKIIPSNEFNEETMKDIPLLHEYDEIRQEKDGDSLTSIICRNIIELREIQALFYKIQAKQIGNEVPPSISAPNLFEDVERKFIPESLPPLIMDEKTGRILLKKYIAQLFAHTGFDTVQKEALEIVIDVVIQYIHNIGHSLKLYIDQFSKETDFLTILEKVLAINQCNPKTLYYYMKNSIFKFNSKLIDLKKKLDYTYTDLCSPQKGQGMYDDDGFMDDDDAFISGNFGEDIGVDFFGFKQMGIDISNIPTELWRRKADHPIRSRIRQLRRRDFSFTPAQNTPTTYQPAPKFIPITDLNTQVIGLLKPYYQKKMIENDMVEDENKSTRVRSKIMRNKAALKKKRDEEDNRRHKEKAQIKKELKMKEKAEDAAKKKTKKETANNIKKELETESSEVIIASGTTTANSTPKTIPSSSNDKKNDKTPTPLFTPIPYQPPTNKDKEKDKDKKKEDKKRKRDDKTDTTTTSTTTNTTTTTNDLKKVKTESK